MNKSNSPSTRRKVKYGSTALTMTNYWKLLPPIAKFVRPYFKGTRPKPRPIYFYSMKEVEEFLEKLPKGWRTFLELTTRHAK